MIAAPTGPADREPAMQKMYDDEASETVTPNRPLVAPGKPAGPNDGPTLTDGARDGSEPVRNSHPLPNRP